MWRAAPTASWSWTAHAWSSRDRRRNWPAAIAAMPDSSGCSMRTDVVTPGAARLGAGIRIAVIDSGVHADHPHVGGVAGGVAIDAVGHVSRDFVDRIGH